MDPTSEIAVMDYTGQIFAEALELVASMPQGNTEAGAVGQSLRAGQRSVVADLDVAVGDWLRARLIEPQAKRGGIAATALRSHPGERAFSYVGSGDLRGCSLRSSGISRPLGSGNSGTDIDHCGSLINSCRVFMEEAHQPSPSPRKSLA